ncbi:MAG: ComEC/Rec2 family competence protein [Bdellovibrionales bacterium]|nr:ComEC/Rec2 family competence protein [Bdellovibrionales bacterium]
MGRFHNGTYTPLYRALCCGASLPKNSPTFLVFRHLGLVHLLVVSGLHLLIIERVLYYVLQRRTGGNRLAVSLLFTFVAACKFAPPVTRAFTQKMLGIWGSRRGTYWSPSFRVSLSGVLLLCLFPQWHLSLSLQLSWTAALILCLNVGPFALAGLLYLALLPFLFPLGIPHPMGLVFSSWAASLVLFPLLICAWLTWLFPSLRPWTDAGTNILLRLLEQISSLVPPPIEGFTQINPRWLWVYILALNIGIYLWDVERKRRQL